ncbi:uncharacterized protein G2W53_004481 [Senna tora]|uniref:Uncharacterized protein n=1 Tax=Senna tora TaxID=362788 RepID=A0A834XAZ6_9FABA|nr:uncharacterized protein G2W53_004481 [Senna tora]
MNSDGSFYLDMTSGETNKSSDEKLEVNLFEVGDVEGNWVVLGWPSSFRWFSSLCWGGIFYLDNFSALDCTAMLTFLLGKLVSFPIVVPNVLSELPPLD